MENPSSFAGVPEKPLSPLQEENIKKQKSWLEIIGREDEIISKNKKKILKLLEKLEKKGIFVGEAAQDFEQLGPPMNGGQAKVYPKFLKSDPKHEIKAVKNIQLALNEPLSVREIDLISVINHENVIKIEKVFLEKLPKGQLAINIVMPFINHDFISWLISDSAELNEKYRMASYSRIPENKRSFEEVRDVLIGTLKGIDQLHLRDIIHLDIKFNNVLVDSNNNALVADLGLAQSAKKLTIKFGHTPGFVAPEVLELFKEAAVQKIGEEETKITTTATITHCFEKDSFEKGDYFTIKADMYSFGVMLYKLFIDEKAEISNENVSKERINERIQQLFEKEKAPVPELLIEDLEIIIKNLLQKDKDLRFDSGILLFEHPYFNKEVTKLPTKPEPTPIDEELISGISDPEELFEIGCKYLEGIDIERDIKKGRRIIEDLSENFAPAKYFTGWMKGVGYGGMMDKEEAKKICFDSAKEAHNFFKPKADQGDPFALFAIGKMYEHGHFLPKDDFKAFEHYKISAKKGNSLAQTAVGEMYQDERSFIYSEKLAAQYFELAANQNNPMAQCRLFWMFDGLGDKATALKYVQTAAEQGDATAQGLLAWRYAEDPKMVETDGKKAIELYTLSAAQGKHSSLNFLANIYHFGLAGIPQNKQLAVDLYKRAAKTGHRNAMYGLARFFEKENDLKSAMEWYEKSAQLGYPSALAALGWAYQAGALGKEKDITKAIEYYMKAGNGKKRNANALYALGMIYLKGDEGVSKDEELARDYLEEAAKLGNLKAKEKIAQIWK